MKIALGTAVIAGAVVLVRKPQAVTIEPWAPFTLLAGICLIVWWAWDRRR